MVRELSVDVTACEDRELALHYRLVGEVPRLRVPTLRSNLALDRLWEHTCFELFASSCEDDGYCEWNFSPSGQRVRFEFVAYRRRAAASRPLPCVGCSSAGPQGLELQARVSLPVALGRSLRVGLAAVIEDESGARSYWALHHGGSRPDFHHRDGFALALDL